MDTTGSHANLASSGSIRSVRPVASIQRSSKKTRTKNRGSQTCSSDDDDLHSDDNLRPYEEVKVAHHDKKLAGLGLTPDENTVTPIMSSNATTCKQNMRSAARAYGYASDEEAEARVPLQGRPTICQQHRQALQHPQHEHVVTAQTSESDEDNRHTLQRSSQAGTLPMPPPTFPPPPPPPIEDIPQRSPLPTRQRSFGPSVRGNYSDADFRRQQNFSDGEHEQPMENPYMVQ
ncbi:unnamed protein product, partial [Lymnaea stagnalis]